MESNGIQWNQIESNRINWTSNGIELDPEYLKTLEKKLDQDLENVEKEIFKIVGHEFNIRSGTENIPGIVGFAEAVKISDKKDIEHMTKLRDKMIKEVLKLPCVNLNGPTGEKRLCNNVNFSFRMIEGESIIGMLDLEGIAASTGSACSSHTLEPSHVLMALGLSREEAHGSLRLTISKYTKEEEIDYLIKKLPDIVKRLRSMSPLGGEECIQKK